MTVALVALAVVGAVVVVAEVVAEVAVALAVAQVAMAVKEAERPVAVTADALAAGAREEVQRAAVLGMGAALVVALVVPMVTAVVV